MVISERDLDLIEARAFRRLDIIAARMVVQLEGERAEGATITSPVVGAFGQAEGTRPGPEQQVVGE